MIRRNRRDPFLALFDGADPNATTPHRQDTTVPTQALYVLNDPFFHDQADRIAGRVLGSTDEPGRLDAVFRLCYRRPPTAAERDRAARFLGDFTPKVEAASMKATSRSAWAALVRILLASNQFLYLD